MVVGIIEERWNETSRQERVRMQRLIKENLLRDLKESSISEREISEWLWEDFGKRVPPKWDRIERAILGDKEITPQDIAVFMIDNGIQPREGAWDVVPLRGGMQDNKEAD